MSPFAIPERSSAAITRRIRPPLSASAAFAVAASVSSPKVNSAVSGTTLVLAVPSTVTVLPLESELPCAVPGRATATAPAAASTAASAAIEIVFMVPPGSLAPYVRRKQGATSRRGGGVPAEAVQVRLPAVRDPRRREVDEEHRRRRLRLGAERHRDLFGQAVPLAHVAGRARGDDVLPDRVAAPAPRNDVVERQLASCRPAVHAAPAVPGEQGPARDLPLQRPRDPDVLDEPDYVRPRELDRRRSEGLIELLVHLGLALEHEHVGAPNGRDVQGLVA